jgi:hypothetical protein
MSDADPRIERALAGLRREWSPPPGVEAAMLADLHARLADAPAQPLEPSEPPGPPELLAQLGYATKIVVATLVTTAIGLGVVAGVGRALRPASERGRDAVVEPLREVAAAPGAEAPGRSPAPARQAGVEPTREAGERPAPRPAPRTRTRERASEPASIDLAAELALLRAAEAASGEDSLARLDEHAERFAKGALASEREGLTIVRLCELGRVDEARPRAEAFARAHASSLMHARIEKACSK